MNTTSKEREAFDKSYWHVDQCPNPNKSWIVDNSGNKMSALMSTRTARKIVADHNQTIAYLKSQYSHSQPAQAAPDVVERVEIILMKRQDMMHSFECREQVAKEIVAALQPATQSPEGEK